MGICTVKGGGVGFRAIADMQRNIGVPRACIGHVYENAKETWKPPYHVGFKFKV